MSTPTPRTDQEAAIVYRKYCADDGVISWADNGMSEWVPTDLARNLETELIAALARVAELEEKVSDYETEHATMRGLGGDYSALQDSLQREARLASQLSESQAQLKQARSYHHGECKEFTGKGRCNCWVMSVGEKDAGKYDTRVKELEAQLTSAREDSARLDWLEGREDIYLNKYDYLAVIAPCGCSPIGEGKTVRSAIDSARGHLAETPAGGETGKDTWQDISTAPKDGKFLGGWWSDEDAEPEWLQCVCRLGKSGMPLSIVGLYSLPQVTKWSALPPPPQGKETK